MAKSRIIGLLSLLIFLLLLIFVSYGLRDELNLSPKLKEGKEYSNKITENLLEVELLNSIGKSEKANNIILSERDSLVLNGDYRKVLASALPNEKAVVTGRINGEKILNDKDSLNIKAVENLEKLNGADVRLIGIRNGEDFVVEKIISVYNPEHYSPGVLIVKFFPEVKREKQIEYLKFGKIVSENSLGIYTIEVSAGLEKEIVEFVRENPDVEFAEMEGIVFPEIIPNDPQYSQQWHLPITSSPTAWDFTTGDPNVVVAVLDTGIDASHPDLASKLIGGWNTYENSPNIGDVYGHGTKVSGVAGAVTDNGVGVASINWQGKIFHYKVSDDGGGATTSAISGAITRAANDGAKIATFSYSISTSSSIQTATLNFMNNYGGLVFASAGNQATFVSSADNPIMVIGATTSTDALASFSNTGNLIDLVAPGAGIRTTIKEGGYGSVSGTSFSAPMAAAAAALIYSINPEFTGYQVEEFLEQGADDLGVSGWDTSYGWGRLNIGNSVLLASAQSCIDRNPEITISPTGQWGNPGETLYYAVRVTNKNSGPYCGSTTFNVAPSLTNELNHNIGQYSVSLLPGQYDERIIQITSSPEIAEGFYSFTHTVSNSERPSFSASVSANYNVYPSVCVRQNPSVTISPQSQSGAVGDSRTYSVTITNNNNILCENSEFYIAGNVYVPLVPIPVLSESDSLGEITPNGKSREAFIRQPQSQSITLGYEQQHTFTITITPTIHAEAGLNQLPVVATNTQHTEYVGMAMMNYNVIVPDTILPSINIIQPLDGTTITGGGNFVVEATATDNIGVSKVEIFLNNVSKKVCLYSNVPSTPICSSGNINKNQLTSGQNIIRADATDSSGNIGQMMIVVHR